MSFLSSIEHSVERGVSEFGHEVVSEFSTLEHDVVNSARVGEVLAKGAWDYTVAHPGDVAKTLVIAAGVGLVAGALTPLLPAIAIVGVCGTLGVVGTAAMGIQTVESFKQAWPDLEIVWDADHHSQSDVSAAEKNVEHLTGAAVTNLALLPVTFVLGSYTGNMGTQAVLAARAGGEIAATSAVVTEIAAAAGEATTTAATAATEATVVTTTAASEATVSTTASAAIETAAGSATASDATVVSNCAHPDVWTRVENDPVFGFFSSPYVERNDLATLIRGLGRAASAEAPAVRRESSV